VAQLALRVRPLTTTSTAARRASLPAVGNGCRPLVAASGRSEAAESGSAGPRQLVGKVVGLEGGVRAQGGVWEAVTALQKRPYCGHKSAAEWRERRLVWSSRVPRRSGERASRASYQRIEVSRGGLKRLGGAWRPCRSDLGQPMQPVGDGPYRRGL